MPTPEIRVQAPPTVPPVHELDTIGLIRRCGGEADLAQLILLEFVRSYPSLAERLDTALRAADPRQVEEALHAIAGVTANIGAPWVSTAGILLRRRVEREGLTSVAGELAAWRAEWLALPAIAQRAADHVLDEGF